MRQKVIDMVKARGFDINELFGKSRGARCFQRVVCEKTPPIAGTGGASDFDRPFRQATAIAFRRERAKKPMPPKPATIIAQVDASGVDGPPVSDTSASRVNAGTPEPTAMNCKALPTPSHADG